MHYKIEYIDLAVVVLIGLAIRAVVSLSSYSGASKPPMFGDYEAQRHWQEITHNVPITEWYTNSTNNDILYWGLDYPPLTAYHSYWLSLVASNINSSYVKLFQSRGFESGDHKSFMRLTVLVADIFIYFPASILIVLSLEKAFSSTHRICTLVILIGYPGLILIDNGHFQYNNISLGLMLLAVAAILHSYYNWASFLFSLALNYKQMELYHALPFFVYLLKASFSSNSYSRMIFKFFQIATTTVSTFVLLWLPWILSIDSLMKTVLRLFPFNRGVFEDKVANVWCSLNVLYKFKKNFQNSEMAFICLLATLIVVLPINIHMFLNLKKKNFVYSMFNTALSFFLLSFQVHEKSILLAAIPIISLFKIMPFLVLSFLKISVLSLYPLLIKDNLHVVYFCMVISYCIIFKYLLNVVYSNDRNIHIILNSIMNIIDITIIILSTTPLLIPSPINLPFLWSLLISLFCCVFFVLTLFVTILHQFNSDYYFYKICSKIYYLYSNILNKEH